MASRISQMRNGQQPYLQTPQAQQQQSLNESIARTRALMQQFQNAQNPEAMIANLIQTNPQLGQLSTMLRNGQSLEGIAKQMAQVSGIDINQLIKQLQGGI